MFIELVDSLRCTAPHEESWLVLSASRMEGRHVLDGMLGCPVCRAEYPIADGEVLFGAVADADVSPGGVADVPPPAPEAGIRLAAQLSITDRLGFAILCGEWARHADALHGAAEAPLLLVNPPRAFRLALRHSVLRTDGRIPTAAGAARAVAIAGGIDAAAAVRAARTGGRIAGPLSISVPHGVRELVRDEAVWVGEREPAPSPLVTLHVRRGDPRGAPPPLPLDRPAGG